MAHFGVVKNGIIVGSYEVDSADHISVEEGEVALPWDEAMGQAELNEALTPPPDTGPTVPDQVNLFQARVVMATTPHGGGTLLEAVEAAIDAMTNPMDKEIAQQGLAYANVLNRNGRIVTILSDALGLDAETIDGLFQEASAIQA